MSLRNVTVTIPVEAWSKLALDAAMANAPVTRYGGDLLTAAILGANGFDLRLRKALQELAAHHRAFVETGDQFAAERLHNAILDLVKEGGGALTTRPPGGDTSPAEKGGDEGPLFVAEQ